VDFVTPAILSTTSSRCHVSPTRGRRRWIWLGNCWANLHAHYHTVSWLTMMPRPDNSWQPWPSGNLIASTARLSDRKKSKPTWTDLQYKLIGSVSCKTLFHACVILQRANLPDDPGALSPKPSCRHRYAGGPHLRSAAAVAPRFGDTMLGSDPWPTDRIYPKAGRTGVRRGRPSGTNRKPASGTSSEGD
jgi:hypothetical protein